MARQPGVTIWMETFVKGIIERRLALSLLLVIASWALPIWPQNSQRDEAIALERQGKLVEAEAAWGALAKQYPTNPEPFAHLGLLEARQERYADAIVDYRKAMALNPSMPGLRLNLGLAYFKAGDYKNAIGEFGPLQHMQPDDERLTVLMGMSHYGLGQFAAAAPFLKQATKSDPNNLPLLLTLAHSCLLSNQYPCVLDAYHRMIALNAESAEADMLVGEALDEMKDTIGAMREFRAAIVANPKEPNVHFGLGYLLWTKGQYPEAAKEFQAELDNDPHHLQAMAYLADSYVQMNRMDDARPRLEELVKLDPGNSMGHLDLGIVYAEEDRKEEALREFQTAARLKPDDVNAHWRLARLYSSMGKKDEAKAEFAKAKSLNKAADEKLLRVMSRIPAGAKKSHEPASTPNDK
jgi:tetratricopeptide (TPR) repeat protein